MKSGTLDNGSLGVRQELVELSKRYHACGWMLGTSGNLSARFNGAQGPAFAITASSLDKGLLRTEDFVEVDLSGELIGCQSGRRPSAETSIHLSVYQACPNVNAVLHVHSVASTELGRRHVSQGHIRYRDLEMLKGWGFWEADACADLPVFENHSEVPNIASELAAWLHNQPATGAHKAPAMLIASHGMTSWGASLEEAHRHLEITEFLCRIALERLGPESRAKAYAASTS